jgi:hypothetical protein
VRASVDDEARSDRIGTVRLLKASADVELIKNNRRKRQIKEEKKKKNKIRNTK